MRLPQFWDNGHRRIQHLQRSLGAFAQTRRRTRGYEYVVTTFMMVAGTNFVAYLVAILQPFKLAKDIEWRTYLFSFSFPTLVIAFGLSMGADSNFSGRSVGLFQVVSIVRRPVLVHDTINGTTSGRRVAFF